jgi:lipoprotein-anchoring transpeptidase ErfK/SrfK
MRSRIIDLRAPSIGVVAQILLGVTTDPALTFRSAHGTGAQGARLNDSSAQPSASRRPRSSIAVVALAVLVPAVPIIAGFIITSGTTRASPVSGAALNPVSQTAGSGPTPPARSADTLPPGSGAVVALLRHATTMRTAPGGPAIARVSTRTQFGTPVAYWVVKHNSRWLGVISSTAGNGKVGWIPRSAASLGRVQWQLNVSLSGRRLTVTENGKVRQQYTVAVGRPDAPTPTGRFAVTDRLSTGDPSGPYGCCILALSAHSPHAIQGWSGGNRIAIHSTPDSGSIGQAVSHGCVRLTLPEGRWLLDHVPLGTPAIIRS